MAGRKTQGVGGYQASIDRQKQSADDAKMRLECAKVVIQLQTAKTHVPGLTRSVETFFQYITTGKPIERT